MMWPGAELVRSIFMAESDLTTVTQPKVEEKSDPCGTTRSLGVQFVLLLAGI